MNKTLWIMIGAPGSGKSWAAKNILMKGSDWRYISRDEVRFSIITDEDQYFDKEDAVFHKFISSIKSAFSDEGVFNVIADATHLNWGSRRKLLRALGQDKHKTLDIIPVYVNAPLEEIYRNNEERSGRSCVPRDVVHNMYEKITDPMDDPYDYTAIMYIDNRREK